MQSISINAINHPIKQNKQNKHTQVLSLKGGAPPTKKRTISMAEIRATDNDEASIKQLFSQTTFKPVDWLNSLNKDRQKQKTKQNN